MELRSLTTVESMLPYLGLVQQLTPSLTLERFRDLLMAMVPHRYAMVAAFEGPVCTGLSGYWIGHKLYCGRYLEIDNFVVDAPYRARGVGQLLLDHLRDVAKAEGCEHLMLDAYLDNTGAHRFYERHGFSKRGYHFMLKV